jgi:hypothetical protein
MLTETVSLRADERAALNAAYERACEELGLGDGSLDVAKRERVAELILSFVSRGEIDIEVLRRRAVIHCRNID